MDRTKNKSNIRTHSQLKHLGIDMFLRYRHIVCSAFRHQRRQFIYLIQKIQYI